MIAPATYRPATRRPGAILRLEVTDALQHERRRAVRGLLLTPLVTPDGPDATLFSLVRRHAGFLEEWFAHHAGWSLTVRPDICTGVASLLRRSAVACFFTLPLAAHADSHYRAIDKTNLTFPNA